MSDPDFYGRQRVGINYAQARYLMLYLQDKGLLTRYNREFQGHREKDPTGLETLKKIISPQSIDDFETEWSSAMLKLHS